MDLKDVYREMCMLTSPNDLGARKTRHGHAVYSCTSM